MGRKHMRFGRYRIGLPASVLARRVLGVVFVTLGIFGFLPVLGFWMIPVGLVILSIDSHAVRRWRRNMEVALIRRWRKWRA